jgi:hypothetical protein
MLLRSTPQTPGILPTAHLLGIWNTRDQLAAVLGAAACIIASSSSSRSRFGLSAWAVVDRPPLAGRGHQHDRRGGGGSSPWP